MSKWSVRTLKTVRNIAIVAGMVGAFLIWLKLPWVVKNSSFMHVGNGAYGLKIGALIVIPFPLFALFHRFDKPEIHTDDPAERAKLAEEYERDNLTKQAVTAIGESIVIILLMALAIVLM
ncbi:MAG: hypothetical protein IKR39_06205 [Lachnospiraceae bacterium]|nr:hypothetical protein [Lachnospiraceae bacterium]